MGDELELNSQNMKKHHLKTEKGKIIATSAVPTATTENMGETYMGLAELAELIFLGLRPTAVERFFSLVAC